MKDTLTFILLLFDVERMISVTTLMNILAHDKRLVEHLVRIQQSDKLSFKYDGLSLEFIGLRTQVV